MDEEVRTWKRTSGRDRLWQRNLEALQTFARSHGTPMAPINSTVTLGGEEVRIGGFVAYVRQRYREGQLDQSRIAQLETLSGWTWGGLRPGPKGHAGRNERIRELRREGWTLTELADEFGMSRQRIHQIAPDTPDPVKHKARLAERRLEKCRRLASEREAVARRGGAS